MFRLQGMDPTRFVVAVPERSLGQQIGSAMSVNVIERVLLRALTHGNLIPHDTPDRWENGSAIARLINTRGRYFRKVKLQHDAIGHGERIIGRSGANSRLCQRILIVDSGASYHLVSEESTTPPEAKTRRKCEPIEITTANGIAEMNECIDIYVAPLRITVTAYILPDTPGVLSLGEIVKEHGFDYIWRCNRIPVLQGNGIKVECSPINDVPFITVGPNKKIEDPSSSSGPPEAQTAPSASQIEPASVDSRVAIPIDSQPLEVENHVNEFEEIPSEVFADAQPAQAEQESQPPSIKEENVEPPPPPAPGAKVRANRKARKRLYHSDRPSTIFSHISRRIRIVKYV